MSTNVPPRHRSRPAAAAPSLNPAHPPAVTVGVWHPRRIWQTAHRVFVEFNDDNGSLMAAAVAFYLLLSLVPLVLAGISVLGFVLGSSEIAQTRLLTFLEQFMPGRAGQRMLSDAVDAVIQARGVAAGLGLAGILFTAIGGFATLETAINVTWNTLTRGFFWNKLFALGMMLVVGVLFLLSLTITAIVQWAGHIRVLELVTRSWGLHILGWIIPIFISGMMFSIIYKTFPNLPTRWKPALVSGFLTAILWEAFKVGYAIYTTRVDPSHTYGTLGGFVGLILWIYYSSVLVLLGSELTYVLSGCPGSAKPHVH